MGGDGALDQKFIDNAGKDADGALITATGAPANVNPDFQKKFNDKYKKDPTLYTPESYDIVNVFLNALAAGSQDRASILNFLTTYDKPGRHEADQVRQQGRGRRRGRLQLRGVERQDLRRRHHPLATSRPQSREGSGSAARRFRPLRSPGPAPRPPRFPTAADG